MVRFGDGRYKLDHAVTKNQRLIMESFGIDTEYLLRQVALVAAALSSQTQPEEQDDENADDENEDRASEGSL